MLPADACEWILIHGRDDFGALKAEPLRKHQGVQTGSTLKTGSRQIRVLVWLVIALLIPSTAKAYIDPNAGSTILFQWLFPMFVAIGAFWVFLKNKVSDFISRLRRNWKPESK